MILRLFIIITMLSVFLTPFSIAVESAEPSTNVNHLHIFVDQNQTSIHADQAHHKNTEFSDHQKEGLDCTETEEDEKEESESGELFNGKKNRISYLPTPELFLFSVQTLHLINFPDLVWRPPQNILS